MRLFIVIIIIIIIVIIIISSRCVSRRIRSSRCVTNTLSVMLQLLHPACVLSISTVLLYVVFGLPLALCPSGVNPRQSSKLSLLTFSSSYLTPYVIHLDHSLLCRSLLLSNPKCGSQNIGVANCFGDNLTKYWEITCNGLVSHTGGVEILLVSSYYANRR